jgi:hypothetical protein
MGLKHCDKKPEEIQVEPISYAEEQDDTLYDLKIVDNDDNADVRLSGSNAELRVSTTKGRIREYDMYERYWRIKLLLAQ